MGIVSGKVETGFRKRLLSGVAALCMASVVAAPSATKAESTYILQLGTFDSRQEAEQKWSELKAKNPETLGNLRVHISEVAMAPDEKTTYRTQAGPIGSHDEASKLCGTLQDKGADCYVVETAMFAADTSALSETAAEPVKTAAPAAEPAAQAAEGKAVQNVVVADRAPRFLDDDTPSSSTAPATVAATPKTEPQATEAHADVKPAETKQAQLKEVEEPSSSIPALETKHKKKHKAAKAKAETVTSADDNAESAKAKNPNIVIAERAPKFLDEGDTPPAPKPVAAAEPPPAAPAPKAEEKKPGFFARLFGGKPSSAKDASKAPDKHVATAKGEGDVSVAEAIRVPLTEGNAAESKPAIRLPAQDGLFESPDAGSIRTFWAQINYFTDEAAAHNFYEEFRNAYPNLSDGVRMRITRPYAYAHKSGHVTLRIGAFASQEDIASICALASQHKLHCVSVKGAAVMAGGTSSAHEKTESGGGAKETASASGGLFSAPETSGTYWVQLGTFDSTADAWNQWDKIKKVHKKATAKLSGNVVAPPASSAEHKMFRLRTGPFSGRSAAEAMCSKLSSASEGCIVVHDE